MALLMTSVDQTIVATALPSLQHDLHAQVNWSSWTITIYALGQILVMPLAGRLGDQYGRKRVFLVAVLVFTSASLCCGLSNNIYLLVALRGLQALGGGAFVPSATGIVSARFGPDRDRALGLFASVFPVGGIIGPILGGLFVTVWSWRWIFLVNVPIGLVLLALGLIFISESGRSAQQPLDVVGVVLLGSTLLPAMFGVIYIGGGSHSLWSPYFLAPELVALVSVVLFVHHSRSAASPFIPGHLLVGRGFGVMNLVNFLFGSAVLGFAALVPLYAEQRYGIDELAAGSLLTARAVGMVAAAALAVVLLRRTGYRKPMIVGFTLVAVGMIGMALHPDGLSPYSWLAVAAGITGVGMGVATPASNNATLQLAPDDTAAVAGLRGMFRQSGGITSISITAAILARSSDPGLAQAYVFVAFAVFLVAALPLILLVPENQGGW
jgi:EmrB/QacA subfamily drug resistance transporter